jgi:hypothetical protein
MISDKLRGEVRERANERCEYCHLPDIDGGISQEIDHIYAEKHGGKTILENLCLSCWICNRYKGTDLTSLDPLNDEITPLFHPRRDVWSEHFHLNGAEIVPVTPQARVTVKLLKLNKQSRIEERRIMILLGRYP